MAISLLSAMSGVKFRVLRLDGLIRPSLVHRDETVMQLVVFETVWNWFFYFLLNWYQDFLAFLSSSTMSLLRKATLEEQTGSNRSPSRCSSGRESARRWRLLSRPWLKHRSNSAPEEPLDIHNRRILAGQDMRTQSLTWSRSGRSNMGLSNPPISRVHSLPDPQRVTSRGVLLEHANLQRDWLSRGSSTYLRSTSEPGTEIRTETPPLSRVPSSHAFSGILLSMSRRISRILNTSSEPAVGQLLEDGRKFD